MLFIEWNNTAEKTLKKNCICYFDFHLIVLHGTLLLSSTDHSLPKPGWDVWDVTWASNGRRVQRSQIRSRESGPASHLKINHHQLLFQQNHKGWRVIKFYEREKCLLPLSTHRNQENIPRKPRKFIPARVCCASSGLAYHYCCLWSGWWRSLWHGKWSPRWRGCCLEGWLSSVCLHSWPWASHRWTAPEDLCKENKIYSNGMKQDYGIFPHTQRHEPWLCCPPQDLVHGFAGKGSWDKEQKLKLRNCQNTENLAENSKHGESKTGVINWENISRSQSGLMSTNHQLTVKRAFKVYNLF